MTIEEPPSGLWDERCFAWGQTKLKTFHGYSRIDAELPASEAIGEPCLWGILRLRRLEGAERWKFRRGARDKGARHSQNGWTS